MTLEQFKEALIAQGYKVIRDEMYYINLQKRNKIIAIQEWENYINVFYEKSFKDGSYELNQHRVEDYKKALNNIKRYEKRLGI